MISTTTKITSIGIFRITFCVFRIPYCIFAIKARKVKFNVTLKSCILIDLAAGVYHGPIIIIIRRQVIIIVLAIQM